MWRTRAPRVSKAPSSAASSRIGKYARSDFHQNYRFCNACCNRQKDLSCRLSGVSYVAFAEDLKLSARQPV